ncbi:MAG TPA: hypothetical protein VGW35_18095 [Methylomirabilota bacterium]|nr:hypothetical protein [Methylomirabilota bacterium]
MTPAAALLAALLTCGGSAVPPASVDPCPAIASRFKTRLDQATGTCVTDADCACYNPVIGAAVGEGA